MHIKTSIVLFCLLALAACNSSGSGSGARTGKSAGAQAEGAVLVQGAAPLPYTEPELSFISTALDRPTQGYPALANTWSVIASLPWPQPAQPGSLQEEISAKVRKQYEDAAAAGKPPAELLAAQLALLPEEGESAIATALAGQQWGALQALRFNTEAGRRLLRSADFRQMSPAAASLCLNLLREWGEVQEDDRPWLAVLSEWPDDPNISLRAAGWLLRLELQGKPGSDSKDAQKWRKLLGDAVREKSRELRVMSAAGEAIRISNDGKMANALVNLADKALSSQPGEIRKKEKKESKSPHGNMGEAFHGEGMHGEGFDAEEKKDASSKDAAAPAEDGDKDKSAEDTPAEGKPAAKDAAAKDDAELKVDPKSGQTSFEILYTMYALAFLPGEQADLLRGRLVDAPDPNVAWHARLGELLAGRPEPWDSALERDGFSHQVWMALQTREAASPLLLKTYEKGASSEAGADRVDTARQLERFKLLDPSALGAEDNRLVALLELLTKDALDPVRQMAWFSAAELRVPRLGAEARRIVQTDSEPPVLRLAACYAALNLLAHGVELPEFAVQEQEAADAEATAPDEAAQPAKGAAEGQADSAAAEGSS
ncbi:hypothetical protein IT575_04805 [bacterium]|nr:hypothetical protein [bacterium]